MGDQKANTSDKHWQFDQGFPICCMASLVYIFDMHLSIFCNILSYLFAPYDGFVRQPIRWKVGGANTVREDFKKAF